MTFKEKFKEAVVVNANFAMTSVLKEPVREDYMKTVWKSLSERFTQPAPNEASEVLGCVISYFLGKGWEIDNSDFEDLKLSALCLEISEDIVL